MWFCSDDDAKLAAKIAALCDFDPAYDRNGSEAAQ
jgi:hypothetical protein